MVFCVDLGGKHGGKKLTKNGLIIILFNFSILFFFLSVLKVTFFLTGLFTISRYSGKASGGIFGGFWPVFRAVVGQFSERNFRKKSPNIPLTLF